jgi:hypothetical protein
MPGDAMNRPRWADYKELSGTFGRACYEIDLENWKQRQDEPPKRPAKNAPPTTVEAVMYELREDGLDALKAPNCKRRIGELSKRQLTEVLARLLKLRPRYPKISDDLLLYLEDLAK